MTRRSSGQISKGLEAVGSNVPCHKAILEGFSHGSHVTFMWGKDGSSYYAEKSRQGVAAGTQRSGVTCIFREALGLDQSGTKVVVLKPLYSIKNY